MEDNKKPQYQPWNEEEFQSDLFVRVMTPVQRWAYRTLLQASFFHTTRPYLPSDDKVLWILAGCESRNQWDSIKGMILERFAPIEIDGVSLLENKRVTADWKRLQNVREEMSVLGKARAASAGRTETGQFKPRLLVPGGNTTSDCPAGDGDALADAGYSASGGPAREVKVSEVKERERESKASNTTGDGDFSAQGKTTGKALGCDWHNISTRHKRILGKSVTGASRHKEKYAEYCHAFTEDVVLECFDEWAQAKREWVRNSNVQVPLFIFWKDLPDMAADILAAKEADAADNTARVQAEESRKKNAAANEEYVNQQKRADWEFMTAEPAPENGASVLEYITDLEGTENVSK